MAVLKIPKVGTLLPAVGAVALVLIVSFWTAAIMVVGSDRARTLVEVDEANRNLARILSEHAARTLDYADRIALQVKARHENAGRGSSLEHLIRDGGINRKIVPGIVVVNARGDIQWMDAPMTRKVNLADREHFKVHVDADTGKPFVSRPLAPRALGLPGVIFVSRRLNRRDGSFDGIVSVAINPDSFTGFYREVGLGEKGLIALTGLDGFVRARGSDTGDAGGGQDVRKGELFQEYGKRDAGTARIRNVVDGVMRRVAFRKLDNYPMVMTVGVAEETVLAAVNLRARTVYIGSALASVLALLAAAALLLMVRRRERDAATLVESEARYRGLLDTLPDAVFLRRDEKIVYVNAAALKLLGAESAAQLIGKTTFDILHPDSHEDARNWIGVLNRAGRLDGTFERQYVRLDGTTVDVEISAALINDNGAPTRQVVSRDITARKRVEAALYESMERYRRMVEASPDATFINRDNEIIYANPAALRLLGADLPEQLVGKSPLDIVHPDDRAAAHMRIEKMNAGSESRGLYEQRFLRLDGSTVETELSASSVVDQGMPARQVVVRDITPRKKIEAALRDSEVRYRSMVESSPDAIIIYEEERAVYVNAAAIRMLGADSAEALIGRTMFELVHPGGHAAALARRAFVLKTGQPTGLFEQTYMRLDGGKVEVEGSVILIPDSLKLQRLVVLRDVSARRRAEAALRESEARLRMAVEAASMTNWEWDLASGHTHWGLGHERLLGPLPEHSLKYPDFRDMVHADDRARFVAAGRATVDHDVPYNIEFRLLRTDGFMRWVRHTGRAMRDAAGTIEGIAGVMQDVTRQHEIERELALSQQRRDALLESNPEPSWLKDCDGRYIAANRAWFARHGIALHNIAGKTDLEFFSAERATAIRDEDRRVIETRAVIRSERNWIYPGHVDWIETVKAPVLDGAGKVVAVVGISHDVSERKRNEQAVQKMNESLGEKTAELTALNRELESFAYTVSHDLRAPLRHIDGFVNLLKSHAGASLDAQSTRYFDRVSHAARRMGLLIDDLLAFSRTGRAELRSQRVALERLLRETIGQLAPDIRGRRIEWTIGTLPEVQGDAGLLAIVFQNLVGNAVKYTRPREVASIDISTAIGDDGMTTIAVRDNGVGFDMKYQHKLFGVFQRLHTDAEFEGTGIGLATVARIVQRHGGRVWAESVEGEGACFFVALPPARRAARAA